MAERWQGALKFKRGSKEAKAFMAKLRGMKGKKKKKRGGEQMAKKGKKRIKLGKEFGAKAGVYEKVEKKKKGKKRKKMPAGYGAY